MNENNPQAIISPLYEHSQAEQNTNLGHISFNAFETTEIPPQISQQDQVWQLSNIKQEEYARKAKWFRFLHYFLVISAGVCSILTPVLLSPYPIIAQVTSTLIGIFLVVEYAIKPKEKWITYSKASDLIQLQKFKSDGTYAKNKLLINTIMDTEAKILETVPDLNDVLSQMNKPKKKSTK